MNIVKLERAVKEWNRLNEEADYWLEKYQKLCKVKTTLRKRNDRIMTNAGVKLNRHLTKLNKVSDGYYKNYRKALEVKQKISITEIAKLIGCRVKKQG